MSVRVLDLIIFSMIDQVYREPFGVKRPLDTNFMPKKSKNSLEVTLYYG